MSNPAVLLVVKLKFISERAQHTCTIKIKKVRSRKQRGGGAPKKVEEKETVEEISHFKKMSYCNSLEG